MLIRFLISLWRRLGFLPLSRLHAIGQTLGLFYDWFPNRERHATQVNLELCYPGLSPQDRRTLRRTILQQIGCSLMELPYIWFRPMDEVSSLVREVSGASLLERDPGQGLILLLPHLGCWEVLGLTLPPSEKITSLYRPPRESELEDLVKQARERNGSTLVSTDTQGVKQIYLALQSGGTTCILPDQQPKSARASVFAPFFGIPALTMLLINRLARKTGAKVIYGYAERLPKGRGFHIHYYPAPPGIDDEDPQVAAAALNQGLETVIRHQPEQYQWSYKRFHDQPDGKLSPYY
ncbi:MAG: lysophospholipid acyltransferase family protein [Candidatus Thiodiazotropha sp. (ex Gloverina cf. vestifex)]|nr:lysophospholipid acyltransferase family protein [Candidatus Thiodiazotropha sp. (ex Gloverina cf. vestifex)]